MRVRKGRLAERDLWVGVVSRHDAGRARRVSLNMVRSHFPVRHTGPVVLLGWALLFSGESCEVGRYSCNGGGVSSLAEPVYGKV
jgi:hypothetical protein